MNRQQKNEKAEFTLTREFDAPQEVVFNAFSTTEALNEWWGPVASKNTVIKLDFRNGGIFHYKMDYRGQISYGRFLFIKVEPPNLLEFTNEFADAHGNIIKAPFYIQLPMEIFYLLHFAGKNGKTILTMSARPVNADVGESEG